MTAEATACLHPNSMSPSSFIANPIHSSNSVIRRSRVTSGSSSAATCSSTPSITVYGHRKLGESAK